MITHLVETAQVLPMALPPGTEKLALLVGWTTSLVGVALFIAFCVMMGKTGLSALRHGQFEGGMGAAVVLVAAVFLGAAGAIFGALGIAAV
ncbi:hypothetical protein [Nocardioides pacificus]